MAHRCRSLALLVALSVQACSGEIEPSRPAALVIETEPGYPAGYPIPLTLVVTNTSSKALSYGCGGPGDYPGADSLLVLVEGLDGKCRTVRPTNGQYIEGSAITRTIQVAEVRRFPLAIATLPEGRHVLTVFPVGGFRPALPEGWASPRKEILVRKDASLAAAFESRMAGLVREGSPFAAHLVGHYHVDSIQRALLPNLMAEDAKVATNAVAALRHQPCAPHVATAICTALAKHISCAARDREHDNLLYHLMLSGRVAEMEAEVPSLLALARDPSRESNMRTSAVQHLQMLRFESSKSALVSLLEEEDLRVSSEAARALAQLKDDRALPRLLADARQEDSERKRGALWALENFPGSEEVEALLRAATTNPDKEISEVAVRSLDEIARERERRKRR